MIKETFVVTPNNGSNSLDLNCKAVANTAEGATERKTTFTISGGLSRKFNCEQPAPASSEGGNVDLTTDWLIQRSSPPMIAPQKTAPIFYSGLGTTEDDKRLNLLKSSCLGKNLTFITNARCKQITELMNIDNWTCADYMTSVVTNVRFGSCSTVNVEDFVQDAFLEDWYFAIRVFCSSSITRNNPTVSWQITNQGSYPKKIFSFTINLK